MSSLDYLDVVGVEYGEEIYAKKKGEYPDLTAGTAEGLIGQSYEVDQSAYNYRKSHEGGRVREQIVGGTLAWNQLIQNGDFSDGTNGWATSSIMNASVDNNVLNLSVSNTEETSNKQYQIYTDFGKTIPSGHKTFVACTLTSSFSPSGSRISTYNTATVDTLAITITSGKTERFFALFNNSEDVRRVYIRWGTFAGASHPNETLDVSNVMIIDLTAMFGSTIADYIYSLEQSSAGAGVAWLKQYIDIDTYHAYNAGSLESVQTEGREVVGFNQWDEEWELGGINSSTGAPYTATDRIRSKNFCACLPSTVYYGFNGAASSGVLLYIWFYDENKSFISGTVITNTTSTTPSNACYFKISTYSGGYATYNHDICINISDPAKNGIYEPYEKHTYPVSNIVLRGIPKLVDNQLAFDGDVYDADGTVERKYGIVDLGTLTWSYNSTIARFATPSLASVVAKPSGNDVIGNIKCAKYVTDITDHGTDASYDKIIMVATSGNIFIRDSAYNAYDALKESLSGVYLVYELATPTTETADPYAPVQAVGDTERWIDNRDVPVPVGQNSKYYPDYAEKIDRLPSDFSTLIAPTEESYTATRNYAADDYLIVNNQLYKTTAVITAGTTIAEGTNVVTTTVMEEILEILRNL